MMVNRSGRGATNGASIGIHAQGSEWRLDSVVLSPSFSLALLAKLRLGNDGTIGGDLLAKLSGVTTSDCRPTPPESLAGRRLYIHGSGYDEAKRIARIGNGSPAKLPQEQPAWYGWR
jgi:hypothetical protein